jgi:hypothetical protein
MITASAPRYVYPTETWDAAKCARMARCVTRDGMGTPYPLRGMIWWLPKSQDYNGGTIIQGEWYQGVVHSLPILAEGYRWESIPTWCWRIIGPDSEICPIDFHGRKLARKVRA